MNGSKLTGEDWQARSAHRSQMAARRDAQLLREAASPPATRLTLPANRWPSPPETAFLTACEALTWIGWGEARPKERAAELEAELLEVWGVSANRFDDLIAAFETGQAQPRLIATPEQVQDHLQRREGRDFTFAQLAGRLREDRAKLAHGYELLEVASEVLVKACADDEMMAIGRRGNEPDRAIPTDVFVQRGVQITWWDTIDTDRLPRWEHVRFKYADVLRLWPAKGSENETPLVSEPDDRHRGGRPQKYDRMAFAREMIRLANGTDGLPERAQLTRHMSDWCMTQCGNAPADSVVRDWIVQLDPRGT